ncbi:MAG: response regulator [Candidatus Competibacteraceae bacterium]|nr:response regulator [Candidatus Competibacteraceae bacterium]
MALDVKKFLGRFIDEAHDHIARLEDGLIALEKGSMDREAINALFRSAHTIKGSSRMLKLTAITETAHRLEEVLGALRAGKISPTPELGSLLMRAVDAIHTLVAQVETTGSELPPLDQELSDALMRAATGDAMNDFSVSPAFSTTLRSSPPLAEAGLGTKMEAVETRLPDTLRVRLDKLDDLVKLMSEVVSHQVKWRQRLLEIRALDQTAQGLLATCGACPSAEWVEQTQALRRFTLDLRDNVQEQERLAQELSDQALVLRMLPLSQVLDPTARMARELARSLGKEVRCEVSGSEIELDREIIDRLSDVLTHLTRNAIDHGIESPEERQATGKPPISRIRFAARQEGAGVIIEVADDGRGLDREKILAKAAHSIGPQRGAEWTDDQVAALIFQPGLSTSALITDLSGRGVGMDVVKRTIVDDLHGAISIANRPGEGITFTLKLPLSLVVMRVLLFQASGQTFGLTAHHVVELIRAPEAETISVAGHPAVVRHNEFVPLIPLAELLESPNAAHGQPAPEAHDDGLLVVVIGVHQAKLGLVIDHLLDERDMVIKPLPEHLRGSGLVSGMIVTGANELVSVLQAQSLPEAARRLRNEAMRRSMLQDGKSSPQVRNYHILVVDDSLNTREIEKEVLEAYGYQVTLAEDGLDGWQKAMSNRFDAVLTDVEMPGLDGFSLTARLRENEKYHTTPIVIITSREKEEDKRRGIQVGADAYIVKGDFDQSNLVGTLRNLLG